MTDIVVVATEDQRFVVVQEANNTITVSSPPIVSVEVTSPGPQGIQGPQGPQGAQGAQGAQGNPGTPGAAATIAVGTTTTGAPGSSASVTNSGSSSAAVFDFTIPRGDTGATGATGPAGQGVVTGGTTGQVLAKKSNTNYDTEWVNQSGGSGVPYTGATQNVNLGEYGLSGGFITLDTSPTTTTAAVGEISWDDGSGAPSIVLKGGNVTEVIGQQDYARVYNDSGTSLTKGQVVYVSGAQGNRIAVKLARADVDPTSRSTIGFVAESIAIGAEGFVITSGPLFKLNTLGLTQGQPVFLSSTIAGAYTTTTPAAPQHTVILGWIERVHATVGSIYVKVDNGYEIDELHNVLISGAASGNTLIYDAVTKVWKNANLTDGNGISITEGAGAITVSLADGDRGDITVSGSGATWTIDNDVVTYAKIQNVSATDRLLGRSTAGAGDIEEITCTAAGRALLDDVDAAAQRTTLGLGTLATQNGTFSGTSSGTNTGDQNIFSTIAIAGQSSVVADTTSDTLTLVAGSNITLTTNATTDTITINSTASGSGDVVGPASATDEALVRFDLTTGKLIQNSLGTLNDAGLLTVPNLTLSTLTSGSVAFAGTGGALSQDNRNFNWENTSKWLSVSSSFQERVSNGSFTGSASGWTLPTGWAYLSNAVTHNANGTGGLTQPITMNVGERYEVSLTLSNVTVGGVTITVAGGFVGSASTNGTFVFRGIVTTTSSGITINPSVIGARLTVDDVSVKVLSGGRMITGDLLVQGSGTSGVATISAVGKNNGQPGTTRHISLENTGGYTWIDFKFNTTDVAHIGANSSGEVSTWIGGGNGASVYHKATSALVSYNVPSTFTHYGYGAFLNGVNAGGTSNPSSTLMSQGGTALKVKYITANQTLDNSATEWIVDPSAAACNGSPTNACSSYTTEATCLARDAHGGCSWFAGNPCSVYNGDQSSCENLTGCTYEQASCSIYNGNQSSCESTTGCSWNNNPQSCSGFDETTCGSTSGCSQNFDYCSNYSDGGGDGSACNAANGGAYCSYDSGTGACDGGSWYTGCSGSYDSYTCDGSFFTGNCTGTYGAACSGSASCGGIDDQTNCNNEPGCNWATAISLTLPSITSCPDRDYWVYNASSTNADVILVPSSGDTVDHTTSYTLSNYKDWVHVSPFRRILSCSTLSEGSCAAQAGCAPTYANCLWDGSTCYGDPSCTGYGDQSSCEAATYYSGCSGNYVASSNWYVFGK